MVRRPFSTSPSYLQYIRALRDLHTLTMASRDDSPEADAIRDGMDQPWYDLSEVEQRRIKGLSEDLYSVSDPPQQPLPRNPQSDRKMKEIYKAEQVGNWGQALEQLRRWSRYIDPALLSFLRGSLWDEAGDGTTASLFYEHASRLEPQLYQDAYLISLWMNDPDAGRKLAGELLITEDDHLPEVIVTAVHIQFEAAGRPTTMEVRNPFEAFIPVLKRAISRARNGETSFTSPPVDETCMRADLLLAGCHERLGNHQEAILHLNSALSTHPDDAAILVIRGILRYRVESGATDDFKRAAELGYEEVWSYFYLANDSLVSGRFEDCLKMCERGLTLGPSDEVRAILQEWLAISRSELGHPPEQGTSAVEDTIRPTPDFERLRRSLEAFEAALPNPGNAGSNWIELMASTVQAFGPLYYQSRLRPAA
jgi:tetratricopeptide (TPR) repeat protein